MALTQHQADIAFQELAKIYEPKFQRGRGVVIISRVHEKLRKQFGTWGVEPCDRMDIVLRDGPIYAAAVIREYAEELWFKERLSSMVVDFFRNLTVSFEERFDERGHPTGIVDVNPDSNLQALLDGGAPIKLFDWNDRGLLENAWRAEFGDKLP